jgi:cobalt-zinc-cadmium efflux system outer membrane protein
MGRIVTGALFVSCLGLVGCAAMAPSYHPPIPPPFVEETSAAKMDDQPIRATFGAMEGAVVGPAGAAGTGKKLTLDEAIRETLSADPRIHAAAESISLAQADLMTNSLLPNPTFTADGIFLPFRKFTPERPGGPPQSDLQLGFPIDWFLFGKRAAAIASGKAGVDVSGADFANFVRQRLSSTISAFYDILEAEELLVVARENLTNLQKVQKIIEAKKEAGGIGGIEVDRIRLAVYDAQREVRRSETVVVAAKANLQALLGRRGDDPNFDVAGSLAVPRPAIPLNAEDAFALAEQYRPDIISVQRQIAKAEADIRTEMRKAYPTVTPAVALSRQYQRALGNPDAPSYDVYLNMSVPLFDRNQGNIKKANAVLAQNHYLLRGQLNDLRSEIQQAVQDFKVAHTNVTSDDPKQLEAARKVRDGIEKAYKLGGRPLLEVLDAERAYRDTYKLYITSQSSYWHSLHRLNAAIGKQVLP